MAGGDEYFSTESLAIFARNTKNTHKLITQKVLNIKINDIVVASDRASLRVSVM